MDSLSAFDLLALREMVGEKLRFLTDQTFTSDVTANAAIVNQRKYYAELRAKLDAIRQSQVS